MTTKMHSTNQLLLRATVALALLAGCGDSGPRQVEIGFKGLVAGAPFSCTATYPGIGNNPDPANRVLTPADFRFYVHDVRLVTAAGQEVAVEVAEDGTWQHQGVVLLDFEDGTGTCARGNAGTNTKVVGTVPAGTYVGLRFKVGVPFELNHLDVGAQPAPLDLTAMFWNWTGGYRFMRVEGTTVGATLHLGSTGCTPVEQGAPSKGVTSCANANRVQVDLASFDASRNKVVLDVAELWADTDLVTDAGGSKGCMSGPTDPECAAVFRKLGLPFGDAAGGAQALFKVE